MYDRALGHHQGRVLEYAGMYMHYVGIMRCLARQLYNKSWSSTTAQYHYGSSEYGDMAIQLLMYHSKYSLMCTCRVRV